MTPARTALALAAFTSLSAPAHGGLHEPKLKRPSMAVEYSESLMGDGQVRRAEPLMDKVPLDRWPPRTHDCTEAGDRCAENKR